MSKKRLGDVEESCYTTLMRYLHTILYRIQLDNVIFVCPFKLFYRRAGRKDSDGGKNYFI